MTLPLSSALGAPLSASSLNPVRAPLKESKNWDFSKKCGIALIVASVALGIFSGGAFFYAFSFSAPIIKIACLITGSSLAGLAPVSLVVGLFLALVPEAPPVASSVSTSLAGAAPRL